MHVPRVSTVVAGLSYLVLLLFACGGLSAQAPRFIRGDINLDGQVTLADAGYYFDFRFFGASAPRCLDAADVGDDGQLDSFGIGDGDRLLDWLFRDPSPPILPPPFPAPGVDPTMDGLGCADPTLSSPVALGRSFAVAWEAPAQAARGASGVEFFVLVSTGAPIEAFSIVFRADNEVLENVTVDLSGTIFPAPLRTLFMASPVFRSAVVPSSASEFDLLEAGAIFIAEAGGGVYERIQFPATRQSLRSARLLRVLADVRRDAPLGTRRLFQAAETTDFVASGAFVHGVKNELVVLDDANPGQSGLPIAAAPDPTIIVDAEEFLRGDANLDVTLDISDPLAIIGFLFLGSVEILCGDSADANDDGRVDISDASFSLNYLFLGQSAPPAPGPFACGEDPTADILVICPGGC